MNEFEQDLERGRILAERYPDYVKAFRAEVEADGEEANGEEIFARVPDPPAEMTEARAWSLVTYLHDEIERAPKTPAAGKTKVKGGATVLADFEALNPTDEKWFACRAPFSNYAVSSYARVARLVGKPGATARAILKPRTSFNFATRKIELVVQLRRDDNKKRNYPLMWLFENHRPKTPAELARRKAMKAKKLAGEVESYI